MRRLMRRQDASQRHVERNGDRHEHCEYIVYCDSKSSMVRRMIHDRSPNILGNPY
jgi:2-polyprenyl-6-methoxyphenol hydroxylase-like FAD-dependent oxidoreductase